MNRPKLTQSKKKKISQITLKYQVEKKNVVSGFRR